MMEVTASSKSDFPSPGSLCTALLQEMQQALVWVEPPTLMSSAGTYFFFFMLSIYVFVFCTPLYIPSYSGPQLLWMTISQGRRGDKEEAARFAGKRLMALPFTTHYPRDKAKKNVHKVSKWILSFWKLQ